MKNKNVEKTMKNTKRLSIENEENGRNKARKKTSRKNDELNFFSFMMFS